MNKIPWSYRLHQLAWSGLDLLFPPVCSGCGRTGWRWCTDCQARVPFVRRPFCELCGIPTRDAGRCDTCKASPPAYRMMRSWAVFDSPIQNGLHTLKYRRNIALGEALARQMVDFVHSLQWNADLLVPVPLGKKRLRERGYNQVALIAEPLAYFAGIAYAPNALWKTRDTRSQVGLNVSQRYDNVRGAYQADPAQVGQRTVLLMDDVSTTGSTITSCTDALLAAGASQVYAITIARALSHHDLHRV